MSRCRILPEISSSLADCPRQKLSSNPILFILIQAPSATFPTTPCSWVVSLRKKDWEPCSPLGSNSGARLLCGSWGMAPCAVSSKLWSGGWGLELTAQGAIPHDPQSNLDRQSTRLNSSHDQRAYAVFCSKKHTLGASRA